jgi:hypothetical protein
MIWPCAAATKIAAVLLLGWVSSALETAVEKTLGLHGLQLHRKLLLYIS